MLVTTKTMQSRDNISRQIPYSILALILKYEGSLGHDLAMDYIGGIYIHVYRNLLGWVPQPETHTKQFLTLANHLYSSKITFGARLGPIRKERKMVKHMKPWRIAFKDELYIMLKYIEREALNMVVPWPRNVVEMML
ncbi:MAG: hypothetical protein OSB66_03260 [SAR202 cluster bacterium]|nr:hypothetical protein [SAR202 cluster bacterium]